MDKQAIGCKQVLQVSEKLEEELESGTISSETPEQFLPFQLMLSDYLPEKRLKAKENGADCYTVFDSLNCCRLKVKKELNKTKKELQEKDPGICQPALSKKRWRYIKLLIATKRLATFFLSEAYK